MANWFTEELDIVRGMRQQISVAETLHSERTEFQKIDIMQTTDLGRMLVLDQVVNLTEFDEYCYHEMIAHPALLAHPSPRKVLVVGGGDGGTLREVLKHPGIEEAHLCEIDKRVVELSREYLPALSAGFQDARARVHFEDGIRWVKEHPDTYDVIIVDSTDPIGMAKALFEFDFFQACRDALKSDGILINQAEHFLLHMDIIRELMDFGRRLFPIHLYYYTLVPTYPGGLIGFTFFSREVDPFQRVHLKLRGDEYRAFAEGLKYWTPEVHRAAFQLPAGVHRSLYGADGVGDLAPD